MEPLPVQDPAALRAGWSRVHDVVGPPAATAAPLGLYAHGALRGPQVDTRVGPRDALVVPAGALADLGAYANAFPAHLWRTRTGATAVRLRVVVDAPALLAVHRSDRAGAGEVAHQRLLEPGIEERLTVALPPGTGLVWFTLQAGADDVRLLDAGWDVDVAARPGSVVLGSPTVRRTTDVARNLLRVAAAPALAEQVARYVVVDHAPEPVGATLRAEVGAAATALLDVVRLPNLGGAGGYSRVMHEALGEPDAAFVLLLDDDVLVEPAALLRAIEFGRRAVGREIVGLQMLDAGRPGVLDAAAERIVPRTFWWGPADGAPAGVDVAAHPVAEQPRLHRQPEADFAGWWGALLPLEAVRTVGYALPLFLKWDDAEYALRARRAGFETVSLQGAAVWHESWRIKDDARGWPAFFHARNRLVAALLHGGPRLRTGVLLSGFAIEVKQLLALQAFAVERRQEGLAAVLAGPGRLGREPASEVHRLLTLSATAADQQRVPVDEVDPAVSPAADRPLAPVEAPRGSRLIAWTLLHLVRHLVAPVRGDAAERLPVGRGTWWVLPSFDDVFAPTADGAAYFRLRRDRRRFRRLLLASVRLHWRLWWRWPALARAYRAEAAALASPEAWVRHFAS
ncbi:glycosyltransferase [Amnibacterium endophyticum]|uniref:Glycosyltransferase n=1 Tax=Amnibacterium endophyticum TaxID=2109337 RepID=A0ABW4LF27_9MICO